jgi:hypothetical protein
MLERGGGPLILTVAAGDSYEVELDFRPFEIKTIRMKMGR